MRDNVAVIGGGLAGLAASIYLARAGKRVTVFERRRELGGRAATHLRQGFRFNLGPHAVYRRGAGSSVYRELGIPVRGGVPATDGLALHGGRRFILPAGPISLLVTSLLSAKAKAEAAMFLMRLRSLDPAPLEGITARKWLDSFVDDARLREVVEALLRLATYSAATDEQSAAAAVKQLKIAQRGVLYVDEGWQKLVDALHSHAVTAGVNFVTSAHVVRVDHDHEVRAIEVGELELDNRRSTQNVAIGDLTEGGMRGARIPVEQVLLAVDPVTAGAVMGDNPTWSVLQPVKAACLDVALSRLPVPRTSFALGVDRPIYFSVHSKYAQLTPKGGALIHVARYKRTEDGGAAAEAADEKELESVLDELQPGWRDVLVHKRYLPSMTVSNALVTPSTKRPAVSTNVRGLFLAGDWVGDEGLLSDAALASARAAAKAMVAEQ